MASSLFWSQVSQKISYALGNFSSTKQCRVQCLTYKKSMLMYVQLSILMGIIWQTTTKKLIYLKTTPKMMSTLYTLMILSEFSKNTFCSGYRTWQMPFMISFFPSVQILTIKIQQWHFHQQIWGNFSLSFPLHIWQMNLSYYRN